MKKTEVKTTEDIDIKKATPLGIPDPSVKGPGNIQKNKIAVRCLVLYREEHGGIKPQEIYDAPMGRTMQLNGKPIRVLRENPVSGKLETYVPYGKEIGIPASKLSGGRQCLPAKNLMSIVGGVMEKIAVWAIVVAVGIGAILIIAIIGELNK